MSKSTITPDGEWHIHMDELQYEPRNSRAIVKFLLASSYQGLDHLIDFMLTGYVDGSGRLSAGFSTTRIGMVGPVGCPCVQA